MSKPERIILGSGKVYVMEFNDTIPEHTAIELPENELGAVKNGATLVYTPTTYEAKDDLGLHSKSALTDEVALLRLGVMTLNADSMTKLVSTGRVTEDAAKKTRTLKIGGIGNQDGKKYVVRFLHEDKADGDIRVTIVGKNQSELSMAFVQGTETVVNAEFKAIPHDTDGTLIIYEEEDDSITV